MPVHPAIAARFPLIRDLQPGVDVDDVPESALAWFAPYGDYRLPDVEAEDRDIEGPHGPIPVRTYRPRNAPGSRPGLLWNHGGGFTAGDLDMPEAQIVSAEIAARAGAVVVSVDYRLAVGGVRYPVPVEDVAAAWGWFHGAAGELGVDPGHAAIGGASAGANLAVAATLRTRDAGGRLPSAMLLAYPALHFPTPALPDALAAEMRELPPMLRFTPRMITDITAAYLGRITDIPSNLMPGLANLDGLPRTRIVVSEYDDLRPSGELFVEQLTERRIPVELTVARGMLHGHLNLPPVPELPEVGRAIDFLAAGL